MDLTGQALLWPRTAMPSINSCGGIPDFCVSITTCVFSTSASQSLESYSWTYFASGRSTRPFGRSERQRLNVNSSLWMSTSCRPLKCPKIACPVLCCQGASGVEAEPAYPQQAGADETEHHGMGRHVGLWVPDALPQVNACHQR